jgi:hypothetical protein
MPRRGLVIAGSLTLGVPYGLGLIAASSADFANDSGWLVVPVFGPWLTLANREECDPTEDGFECAEDAVVRIYLTLGGLAQATGAVLLLIGLTSTRPTLVRDDEARLRISPMRVGSGYGLGVRGAL